MKHARFLQLLILPITALLAMQGCSKDAEGPKGHAGRTAMMFPVEVQTVDTQSVVYSVSAVGSVEAFEVVQVTARVAGVVEQVRFSEGVKVGAGKALVDIEPDRYRLAVQSARATLEKAQAAKADAEAGLARREGAVAKNPGLIPGEEIETWRTKKLSAAADVAQAKAALDQAELNLRDAFVKAPVPGIIQSRSVQTGQYVQAGAVLATLVRRDPLLLRFKVTEQDAPRLVAGGIAHFHVRNDDRMYTARITLVAASAEENSRMVAVTAEVIDPERARLRPGAFAEVTVPVGDVRPMPVIPQTAIRASDRGFLAYVVEGTVAKERVLTLGLRTEEGMVEVLSGLKQGDRLVIRGGEALREGAAVREAAAGTADKAQQGARSGTTAGEKPNDSGSAQSSGTKDSKGKQ